MNSKWLPIAILLVGVGLSLRTGDGFSVDVLNPINWFVKGPVAVAIIEETKDRPLLPISQISILNSGSFGEKIKSTGGIFLGCFDKDILDRDKQPPKDLIQFLEAAKKLGNYPALVYKRGNRVTAVQLPMNEQSALEVLK